MKNHFVGSCRGFEGLVIFVYAVYMVLDTMGRMRPASHQRALGRY